LQRRRATILAKELFFSGTIITYQVPEVSTLILLGAGMVALALIARWKLKNKK
jgi:hypothetical protein